jgi:UDP-GlcNAc3NAcA epimerase
LKLVTVVGARPQFIKAAPVCFALRDAGIQEILIHTGQHYDDQMSDVFFREMGIPQPQYHLGIGSATHGKQTAQILLRVEELLLGEKPDMVLVYGDTNSTLAAALAACKLNIPIAHVEAGLRSYNRMMPEEHNRVLTDHCSSLLFCPTETAVKNLAQENIHCGVRLVGDTMYDAVLLFAPLAEQRSKILKAHKLRPREYYLVTVHRPYNTDDPLKMEAIVSALSQLQHPAVFPMHPRTMKCMKQFGIEMPVNVVVIEPVGYLDMLVLQRNAKVILTDSGGMQKEACFARTPCVTLRPETEWTETVVSGWNALAWADANLILRHVASQEHASPKPISAFGDGRAAQAIVAQFSTSFLKDTLVLKE